ncbi:MAG TPA: RNA methyltransferase [Vulgatibacter sp.]|nr:RNA methyltransferase [Vulgatibacter sp.]
MRSLFLAAPPGLEVPCADEARALGLADVRIVPGGVACRGDDAAILRANLTLRVASRVLLRVGEGEARDAERIARAVDWSGFVAPGGTFAVEVAGGGREPSRFERPLREAILRQVPSARPADAASATIRARIHGGGIALAVDSSGAHLHQRGYRQETGAAPLRENLAAGILRLAGYDGSVPLLDPMCGSGTFLIEGALVAMRRAPGAARPFACESWPSFPADLGERVRAELRAAERSAPPCPILGSDRNAGALGVARRNATRAGVVSSISLVRRDVAELAPPDGAPGVLVANPPYGKRVGGAGDLAALYRTLGRRLREGFSGWICAVLVADRALGARLELPDPERLPLRNGGIPCTLLLARL